MAAAADCAILRFGSAGRRRPLAAFCISTAVALLVGAADVRAQSSELRFPISIETMPLEGALLAFFRQTGISVAFSPDQLRGRVSMGAVGDLTSQEALNLILKDTGFLLLRRSGKLFVVLDPNRSNAEARAAFEEERRAARAAQALGSDAMGRPDVEEVIVTGSRLTTGFETATAVTSFLVEKLSAAAPTNLADALRQLPPLSATISSTQTNSGTGGANGQSVLNLRNLGTSRNLVLLNGHRVVGSNQNNSVDLNQIPQNLVSRVDVVTGGASAAYGSDAVAGVVNFVLDTDFVGWKGEVSGGISTFGDMANAKGSLAWGGSLANDRLHVIASTLYARLEGTGVHQATGRTWWDRPWGLIANTTGSSSQNLVLPDIRSSIGTSGGVITAGPLKGTQFMKGGAPAPFTYGYSAGPAWQSGGDGALISFNLTPDQERTANFVHAVYDFNDRAQVYVEGGYFYSITNDRNQKPINTGPGFGYTIYSGNPFLPASIQAQMTALGISSFPMGRYMEEYPDVTIVTKTRVQREAVGFKGNLGADDNWDYDVSYSRGRTNQFLAQTNLTIGRQVYAAADAVRHPVTGQIVCRSQWYNGNVFVPVGTGLDPGCRPQNLFGFGSIDPSTIPYTIGDSWKKYTQTQQVVAAAISGNLTAFDFGAGPISVATGAEYRTEKARQTTDDISVQIVDFSGIRGGPDAYIGRRGPFRFGNFQPFGGKYDVKETFAEVGVPLLGNISAVRKLSADAAVRYTDYSTSGGVTTWKVGLEYQADRNLRLRGTVSRDIRAPNMLEFYNTATNNAGNIIYPSSSNGVTTSNVTITSGNLDLRPERALTQTYGVVFTPTAVQGLELSADYYTIEINGGVQTINSQQTIDNCYMGVPDFCQYVTSVAGTVRVRTPYLNLAQVKTAGIDVNAVYRAEILGHPLQLGLVATRLTAASTQVVGGPVLSTLGGGNDPKFRMNIQATYDVGPWSLFLQQRYIGAKLTDAQRIEGVFVDDNTVDPAFYTDATITYAFDAFGTSSEIFFTVNNVTNQEPPKDVISPSSFVQPGNRSVYDWVGRYFNLGLRFRM